LPFSFPLLFPRLRLELLLICLSPLCSYCLSNFHIPAKRYVCWIILLLSFLSSGNFFVLLEVLKCSHKYYVQGLVHAVNYVPLFLFGSENHATSHVPFKLEHFIKISIGTVKNVADKFFRFSNVFHVFEEPFVITTLVM
jgi:hypothetical protein